ncbi:MAG: fluoride efflux transporter CrcB [Pseudomonadota bacterium]
MIAPKALALVALGGALGASGRYVTTLAMQAWLGRAFPWGTLSVNVIGSFAMGIAFVALAALGDEQRANEGRLLLMTGVLGGFTTFSAFSLETLALMEQGEWTRSVANVGVSVALCLAATFAGLALARQWSP